MGIRAQGGNKDGNNYISAEYRDIFGRTGYDASRPASSLGMEATGGFVSEYTDPTGTSYRAHIFNGPSSLVVSDVGSLGGTIEYLVVGGGGGGGGGQVSNEGSGGGGAGGFRTGSQTGTTTTYPITVGAGGHMGIFPVTPGGLGGYSQFGSPTQTYLRSEGGGGGVTHPGPVNGMAPGGSGGGGQDGDPGGTGDRIAGTATPAPDQGNNGGGSVSGGGGGGGGAGAVGGTATPTAAGDGGVGSDNAYATGSNIKYAGGGGAANQPGPNAGEGGAGGGGDGSPGPAGTYSNDAHPGTPSLGGGGGANAAGSSDWGFGASGGSGTVIARYEIASSQLGGTATATGGYVSFTPTKTVHVFDRPGNFVAPTTLTVDYLLVGGGGGGGCNNGGGGGGGEVVVGSSVPLPAATHAVTVGKGGSGSVQAPSARVGQAGWPSVFNSITARGGGGGGSCAEQANTGRAIGVPAPLGQGQVGNGGGGAGVQDGSPTAPSGYAAPATGSPTPTITYHGGNDGGNGSDTDPSGPPSKYNAGGGAGAGGDGVPGFTGANPTTNSNGGVGIDNSILGSPYWWGGGGAGGCFISPTDPASSMDGGKGGGGGGLGAPTPEHTGGEGDTNGIFAALDGMSAPQAITAYGSPAQNYIAGSGAASTGGGGGGCGRAPGGRMGANGGSGVVIIAYPT